MRLRSNGDDDVVVDDGDEGGGNQFGSISCSICLEPVTDNGDRSWAKLQCTHHFHLADAFVSTGLADLGYVYVNIDDCWFAANRNLEDQLVLDPKTFPSEIKALADYVHEKGLKLRIYGDAG